MIRTARSAEALRARATRAACWVLFGMMVEGFQRPRARQRTLCCSAQLRRVVSVTFESHRLQAKSRDRCGEPDAQVVDHVEGRHETWCPQCRPRCLLRPAHDSRPARISATERHGDCLRTMERCRSTSRFCLEQRRRSFSCTSATPAQPAAGTMPPAEDGGTHLAGGELSPFPGVK